MIYEYVLSFDTPLKHLAKMQPFVKEFTGSESNTDSRSSGPEIEPTTDIRRVNTSILTANKLIYVEAITVFYKHNIIHVDSQICIYESIVPLRATDLSLATQVVVKIDELVNPEVNDRISTAMTMSIILPAIFPKLRTCSVYVCVDTNPRPSAYLHTVGSSLRESDLFSEVCFNGVGSVHAISTDSPCLKLVLQSRWTIDRWETPKPLPAGHLALTDVPAPSLYQASRADPQNVYAQRAQYIFNLFKMLRELPQLEDVEQDGYEYWTCIDASLCALQKLRP